MFTIRALQSLALYSWVVRLCIVESSSSAPMVTNVRSCSPRRACLVRQDKGMFAGVVGNAKQKHFARESIVDLATRILERKPALWVIAFGATATKWRR